MLQQEGFSLYLLCTDTSPSLTMRNDEVVIRVAEFEWPAAFLDCPSSPPKRTAKGRLRVRCKKQGQKVGALGSRLVQ